MDITTQHAYLINLVFLVCLFGPGQPLLVIVALCNVTLRYNIERLMLAYFYRRPPVHDSSLNQNTLLMISLAPILYCFSAAWTFSNQQVFRNKVIADKDNFDYYPPPDHTAG